MSDQFTCTYDSYGDLYVTAGVVMQPRQGVVIELSGAEAGGSIFQSPLVSGETRVGPPDRRTHVGGTGRNLLVAVTGAGWSGEAPPPVFRPYPAERYTAGRYFLEGASGTRVLKDADDDVIATKASGSSATGTYTSTTTGRTKYTGGSSFGLTVTSESASPPAFPSVTVMISAGSAQGGDYLGEYGDAWESADDGDWFIFVDEAGVGTLTYQGEVMAIRPAGPLLNPAGVYESTIVGSGTFNLTDDYPVEGEPWRAFVEVVTTPPRDGWVYVRITEVAGVVTAAAGPFFTTDLPAAVGDDFSFPLAYVASGVVRELHRGAILL